MAAVRAGSSRVDVLTELMELGAVDVSVSERCRLIKPLSGGLASSSPLGLELRAPTPGVVLALAFDGREVGGGSMRWLQKAT